MPDQQTAELAADIDGERLDVFVARRVDGLTRSRAQKLIDDEQVTVDGRVERASHRSRPREKHRRGPRRSLSTSSTRTRTSSLSTSRRG